METLAPNGSVANGVLMEPKAREKTEAQRRNDDVEEKEKAELAVRFYSWFLHCTKQVAHELRQLCPKLATRGFKHVSGKIIKVGVN